MAARVAGISARKLHGAFGAWQSFLRLTKPLRFVCLTLAFLSIAGPGSAVPADAGVTTSYGYAVFGDLKYGPNFTHLAYTNPDAPKGGLYRYAGGQRFDSLNQFTVLGIFPYVIEYLYDPLMERSQDEPVSYYGVVAKTITYPRDLSWVEFELRPEARWHDGKPITVEDVLFTLKAFDNDLLRPQVNAAAKVVKRAYQTGPHRVRMELTQKNNPTLPAVVASMKVLPKHYYEGRDLSQPTLERPVTGGPYKIGRVEPGRMFEFVRDENYWAADLPLRKGRFNFDRIQHLFYRDPRQSYEDFYLGRTHMRQEFSAVRWAAENRMAAYESGDIVRDDIPYKNSAFYNSIVMNTRTPFLSDRRVRKAVQLAYDFEFLRDIMLHGWHGRTESYFSNTEFEATGLPSSGELAVLEPYRGSLPPEVFDAVPSVPKGGSRENQRENLKLARDLLAEAGYHIRDMKLIDPKTGQPVVLDFVTYSPLFVRQVGLFIQNMKRLGIEVNFRAYDTSQYRIRAGNYDFDLTYGVPVFGPREAPGVELLTSWSSKSADIPNQLNLARIRSPAIDHALEVILQAQDHQTVVDAMRAIDRIARANYYSIPLQHHYPAPVGEKPIAYWDRFGRPETDLTYIYPLMMLDHWWWDPKKEAQLSHGVFE